jgi:probable rRNA maturation factor
MQHLNNTYRGVNKPTDVLSFEADFTFRRDDNNPAGWARETVLGDIVINIEQAATQAGISGTDVCDEIYRLLIHGTLHLLGYHHGQSRKETITMHKKEREILDAVKKAG